MIKNIFLPVGSLLITLASVAIFYLMGAPVRDHLFNTDALYLPVLFFDIINNNGRISDWYLTPAPYFFPDYLIFLLSYYLGSNTYYQILSFALLQVALTFGVVWLLVIQISKDNQLLISSLIIVLLTWLSLTTDHPFVLLLISAHHYGAFISTILFVAIWLRYFNIDNYWKWNRLIIITIGMSLLIFFTTLSDALFLVQTLVPFTITCFIIDIINRGFSIKKYIILIILIFSGMLGYFSYELAVTYKTRYTTDIGLEKLTENFFNILSTFHALLSKTSFYSLLFFSYLGFGIFLIYLLVRNWEIKISKNAQLIWLSCFTFLSSLSTLSAIFLTTNIDFTSRYLIPVFSWPVIVMISFIASLLKDKFYYFSSLIFIIFFIFLSTNTFIMVQRNKGFGFDFYPEQISCIDNAIGQRRLRDGIAQYWDAKYIQAFSKLKINLAQHIENLEEHRWVTSSKFYKENYDFAIISENAEPPYKISSRKLTEINGEPDSTIICGDKKILIYGQTKFRVRKIVNPGDSFRWKACELPTVIGSHTIECQSEKTDPSQMGYLTFGPYEALPSGKYYFEIEYLSSKDISDIAGVWDVVIALPTQAKIIAKGDLPGTDNKINKISGFFTLEQEHDMDRIEIRTLAHKDGVMRLDYIKIKRLE